MKFNDRDMPMEKDRQAPLALCGHAGEGGADTRRFARRRSDAQRITKHDIVEHFSTATVRGGAIVGHGAAS